MEVKLVDSVSVDHQMTATGGWIGVRHEPSHASPPVCLGLAQPQGGWFGCRS